MQKWVAMPYCHPLINNMCMKTTIAKLGIFFLLFLSCSYEKKHQANEPVVPKPTLPTNANVITPAEREVAKMADSFFDGRPHIIVNSSFHKLCSDQIGLLRTFRNPYAPTIISLIESMDNVTRTSKDTITTRQALMMYYHYYDLLENMTDRLTQEEQSKIRALLDSSSH